MAEGDGMGESSEAVSQPQGASAGAGSRTVFLSYSSPDAEIANQVCQYLESHGVSCWLGKNDGAGTLCHCDGVIACGPGS